MAGIFDWLDELLTGQANASPLAQATAQQQAQPPTAAPQPILNRRDQTQIGMEAARAGVPPPPPLQQPQMQNQEDISPFWKGVGRFLKAETPGGGIGNVIDGVQQDRAYNGVNPYAFEFNKKNIAQQTDQYNFEHLGDTEVGSNTGIGYNRRTGETWTPPASTVKALDEFSIADNRRAAAGRNAGISPTGIASYPETLVDPVTRTLYRTGQTRDGSAIVLGLDNNRVTDPTILNRLTSQTIGNTEYRGNDKAQHEFDKQIADGATTSSRMLQQLDTLEQSFAGASGTGDVSAVQRWLMDRVGIDIGSMNLADKNVYEAKAREMEADLTKQLLGGQGQITEGERLIIRQMLPTLATDPRAFAKIIGAYRQFAQNNVDAQQSWNAYSGRMEEQGLVPSARSFQAKMTKARNSNKQEDWDSFNEWVTGQTPTTQDQPPKVPPAKPPGAPAAPKPAAGFSDVTEDGFSYKHSGSTSNGSDSVVVPLKRPPPAPAPAPVQPGPGFSPGYTPGGTGGPELSSPRAARAPQEVQQTLSSLNSRAREMWASAPPPDAPQPRLQPSRGSGNPAISEEARQKIIADKTHQEIIAASRNSPRGQAYNAKANSVRAMIKEMKSTQDPVRRNEIVRALQKEGFFTAQ